MKVLLTGGAGFIGSHTAALMLDAGFEVVILDNLSNSDISVIDRIKKITGKDKELQFIQADLCDMATVKPALQGLGIDSVIHFAGYKAVGESVEKPLEYYQNNLISTMNLIEVMKLNNITNFVFSSSATVYHADSPVPYFEDYPLGATNPYGWTKVMIEQMLTDICAVNSDFNVVLLRYFNPIGAHSSGMIGEEPSNIPNNLTPYVAKVANGELPYVRVFGDDYDTPDGTGVRDYIHIMDLAEAHILAMNYISERKGLHAFNIGTGISYSVIDVIKAYEKASGKAIPWKVLDRRKGDLPTVYANVDFAKNELGFVAKYTLDDMCRDSWQWQQNLAELKK